MTTIFATQSPAQVAIYSITGSRKEFRVGAKKVRELTKLPNIYFLVYTEVVIAAFRLVIKVAPIALAAIQTHSL